MMERIWAMMLNDAGALNRLESHPSAGAVLSAAGVNEGVVVRAARFCESLSEDALMELVLGDPDEKSIPDQKGYEALRVVCGAFWSHIDS